MTNHTLRIIILAFASIALSGCAVSKESAPTKTLTKKDGSNALVSTKDDKRRRAEEEKTDGSSDESDPRKDPAPAEKDLDINSGGAGGGGFEGDTFDKNPRKELESLVLDINKGIDSYREEFGVEGFSTAQPGSCDEVCDLSEAICKSSTKICAIATNNPGESYFGDKCQWSSKECKRSNEQCATCSK